MGAAPGGAGSVEGQRLPQPMAGRQQDVVEEVEDGIVFSVSLKPPPSSSPGHVQDSPSTDSPVRVRTVKAGTVERLTEHLAPYGTEEDVSYRTCFLSTYRTFTTPSRILTLLGERFHVMAPLPSDTGDVAEEKTAVQSSIISFLHVWLDTHPMDFYSPPAHPDLCTLELLSQQCGWQGAGLVQVLGKVRREMARKTLSVDGESFLSNMGASYWLGAGAQPFSLFTLPAKEFVHSLTAEDKYIFQMVLPHQCLSYIRAPQSAHAPTVRAAIRHFNRVSLITIATTLKAGEGAEDRGRLISRWIEVAQQCRLVKNFSSLKAILSGLQSSAVYRLRRSWEAVPKDKTALLEELSNLFTADDNFFLSRDLLNREGTSKHVEITHGKKSHSARAMGVIPYLGTFLTDLTMTHSAFPDTLHNGLVNFEKRRKEFELLVQLTLYQKAASAYSFPHEPQLVQWLRETRVFSEKESYDMSKELEPDPASPETQHPAKRTVRQLFRTAVGDSFPSSKHSLFPDSHSHRSQTHQHTSSISPRPPRKFGSRTVRVALSGSGQCMYRSIQVSEGDRASSVLRLALQKHGITGDPAHYSLELLTEHERLPLPMDANLYYALSDSSSTLVLTPKDPCTSTLHNNEL